MIPLPLGPSVFAYAISSRTRHCASGFNSARLLILGCAFSLISLTSLPAQTSPTESSTAYQSSEVTPRPQPKKPVNVRYPSSVRKKGGTLTLRFLVTKKGTVTRITVVKFTDPDMIDPAYSAYESAAFSPGMKNGEAVDTWVEITESAR